MLGRVPALILGIETSCDETAAAVVEDGHVVLRNMVTPKWLCREWSTLQRRNGSSCRVRHRAGRRSRTTIA